MVPSDSITFETLLSPPIAEHRVWVESDDVLTLPVLFLPDRDKVSLVLMIKGSGYGRLLLDDLVVSALDPYDRDTVLTLGFDERSEVDDYWRTSVWPDSLLALDSISAGLITHDTIVGRLRVDVVIDPFNEDSVMHYVGAVSRDLPDLEKGREYELDFRFFEGASPLRKLQVMLLPGSLFSAGILDPSIHVLIDSMYITDSVSIRFTATESKMTVLIVGESAESANHYFIDDFELREGWVEEMVCPNRMQYAGRSRYRWGFNGMERDDEVKGIGNSLNFGARIYDGRLGRFLSTDPLKHKYSYFSPYIYAANSPISLIDRNGEEAVSATIIVIGGVALTVGEAILISTGIITSGILLHQAANGTLAFNYDISNPFGSSSSWSTSRGDGIGDGSGVNYTGKPRGPRDPFPPNRHASNLVKFVVGTGLASRLVKQVYDKFKLPEEALEKDPLQLDIKAVEPINDKGVSSKSKVKYDILYTIQKNDNLTKIAETFNTTVDNLVETNNIKDRDIIVEGTKIKVGEGSITQAIKQ